MTVQAKTNNQCACPMFEGAAVTLFQIIVCLAEMDLYIFKLGISVLRKILQFCIV